MPNTKTTFFLWKKSLAEFSDLNNRDKLVYSALLDVSTDENIVSVREYTFNEISQFEKLNINKNALFHDVKWVLEIQDKLCPIRDIFDVVRGERRGWDKMFYPSFGHGIESQYIKPVLKSPKEINSLITKADGEAFCCEKSIEYLKFNAHNGALNWINRFIKGSNEKGKPLTETLKRKNLDWYQMSASQLADFVTALNPESRLFYASFNCPTFINQRLVGLRFKSKGIDKDLCHALLNSILGMFYIEVCGFGRGLGVLDLCKTNIGKSFMLNPSLLNKYETDKIKEEFKKLKQRDIKKTEDEMMSEDREKFDRCVLKAFGIENYYEKIKKSLLSLQRTRLSVKYKSKKNKKI